MWLVALKRTGWLVTLERTNVRLTGAEDRPMAMAKSEPSEEEIERRVDRRKEAAIMSVDVVGP